MAQKTPQDRATQRERLQDARNAERGSITSQAQSLATELATQGAGDMKSQLGKGTKSLTSGTDDESSASGDKGMKGLPAITKKGSKESTGNAITDRSKSAYAVGDDDSFSEKTAASVSSAVSRLDNKSKNAGEKALDKVEDTAVSKAEQISKKAGAETVGGGAEKLAGAAAADATRLGAGAAKAGARVAAQDYGGAVKDAGAAIAKTKTFQKVMALVIVPGCLIVGVIGMIIVAALGSTVINMIVATNEDAQEQVDTDISEEEDDPDSDEAPCRATGAPADC